MTPVNVFSKIKKEKISIGVVAILDVLLIAFLISLSMSKFVLAPGLSIDLNSNSKLPTMAQPEYVNTSSDLTVLTAKGNSMIIFEGSICDRSSLVKKMQSSKHKGTILIKADKSLSIQELLDIVQIAKLSGFQKIHIAAKPEDK